MRNNFLSISISLIPRNVFFYLGSRSGCRCRSSALGGQRGTNTTPPGLSAHIFGHLLKSLLTEALAVILTEHSDGRKETGGVTGQHHPADQVTCLSCPRASEIMTLSLALIILPSCDARTLDEILPRFCPLVATTVSLQQPVRSLRNAGHPLRNRWQPSLS